MKFLSYLILLSCVACGAKDNREGLHTPDGDYITYSDSTTGWTTRYPKNWKAISPEEIKKIENRGQDAIEETVDGELELSHRNLLWLQKDNFNSMTSNYQPFDPSEGTFEENEAFITSTIEETFRQQGLQFESSNGKAMLDGLEFIMWTNVIFSPDRSDTLMTQVMYSRLIDNRNTLTLNINYGNIAERDTLNAIIQNSRFRIRD